VNEIIPLTNGSNGRDDAGRFAKGCPGGPGSPNARRVAELKSALLAAVSPEDVTAIVRSIVAKAIGGDVACAKLVLDRCLGRPETETTVRIGLEQNRDSMSSVDDLQVLADAELILAPLTAENLEAKRSAMIRRIQRPPMRSGGGAQ
jgi:hypothetical protein